MSPPFEAGGSDATSTTSTVGACCASELHVAASIMGGGITPMHLLGPSDGPPTSTAPALPSEIGAPPVPAEGFDSGVSPEPQAPKNTSMLIHGRRKRMAWLCTARRRQGELVGELATSSRVAVTGTN